MWLNVDVVLEHWLGRQRVRPALYATAALGVLLPALLVLPGLQCRARTDQPLCGVKVLDVETGRRFTIALDADFIGWPVVSPATGRPTGYPAEVCRQPGCRDRGGTWVVLNALLGRPGPTRCPACDRIVRPRHGEEDDFVAGH